MCLGMLVAYDVLIASRFEGRWFNVHAFANAITVLGSIPAMVLWMQKPMHVVNPAGQEPPDVFGTNWWRPDVLLNPSSDWPVLMIIAGEHKPVANRQNFVAERS